MDSSGRALGHTLLAELALCEIDVCDIVLHGDRLERTCLRALSAADTCGLAGLARYSALVPVHA